MAAFKQMLPDQAGNLDQVTAAAMAKDATLYQAAAGLVTPVDHTIKIEPVADAAK